MHRGKPNRLAREKSPYLLQHAYNPVDWYPWGEEALGRAKAEDKPVFLSIGYSTCHWCHVMARESFENPEVAALMNRYFVNIKVDREERPEIDQVYMEAALALMGTGGWPLSIVMTPDGEPFFAATYIPRESGLGLAGMLDLLPGIAEAWRERREQILTAAGQLTLLVRMRPRDQGSEGAPMVIARVLDELKAGFDPEHGGFGGPPKFPAPHALIFLLRAFRRTGDRDLLAMAEKTMQTMHAGGIYDHIGSGFHRYATDNAWRLPHFEKMLYDQALLAMAYTEAYLVTGRSEYRTVAEETLGYMIRDLRSEGGAFASAEDAESDGREGGFYLWTRDEIGKILSGTELAAFAEYYGICREGNLPREPRAGRGENVLYIAAPGEQVERDLGMKPGELGPVLASARGKVRAARTRRSRPARDGKILTDWNGLAIAALALGSRAFGSREYRDAATEAAGFILARLTTGDGGLLHRYVDGDAAVSGIADDYAFLVWGFLELYHASLDPGFLSHAVAVTDRFLARFWDREQGGFFFTPDTGERLIARLKPVHDGSIPSANSVALSNLITLFRLTGRTLYLDRARELAEWYLRERASSATASTWMMASLDLAHAQSIEVVVAGDPDAPDTRALIDEIRSRARPEITVLLKGPAGDTTLEGLSSFLKGFTAEQGKAVAYLCRNHACELPIMDPGALGKALDAPFTREPVRKE